MFDKKKNEHSLKCIGNFLRSFPEFKNKENTKGQEPERALQKNI